MKLTDNGPESPHLSKWGMNGRSLFGAWIQIFGDVERNLPEITLYQLELKLE